jgi:uncharacterized RDD family membrane protein YckC
MSDQHPNDLKPEPAANSNQGSLIDNSAGYGKRFVAAFIDAVLIGICMAMLFEYLGIVPDQNQTDMQLVFKSMVEKVTALSNSKQLFLFLFPYGMFFVLHGHLLFHCGQTIGKRIMGIAIVTLDNQKPSFLGLVFNRYLTQWVVGLAPGLGALLRLLDVLTIFFTNKRCVHDLIAKTKVIDLRIAVAASAPNSIIA